MIELEQWQVWLVLSAFCAAIPLFLWEDYCGLSSLRNRFSIFLGLQLSLVCFLIGLMQFFE